MVRSSGTSKAVPPTPSSPFRLQIFSSRKKSVHRPSSSTSSTSSGKGVAAAPHVSSDLPERRHSIAQAEQNADANRTIRGNWNIDRFSRSTEGTSRRSSRSNSVDLYSSPVVTPAAVVAPLSPATAIALRVRPVPRLPAYAVDTSRQVAPRALSAERRGNNNPLTCSDSPLTTPPTSTVEAFQFSNSSPQRNWARSDPPFTAPIVPPLDYQSARDPIASETPPTLPKPSDFTSAHLGGRQSREPPGENLPKARDSIKRERRSQSTKEMLSSALQKANTAVTLDNAENYEGAMEAYSDACVLLDQVMLRAGADDDRRKLQAIHETYTQRIEELRTLSPRHVGDEKELPARPFTEEFTDQDSLYPLEDDESTVIIPTATATPVVGGNRYVNGVRRTTAVPPRRDSLFVGPSCALGSGPVPPLPITRSRSAEPMSSPRSPKRLPRSPNNGAVIESDSLGRGMFDGGGKEKDHGIRRSVSDASSISSRRSSHRQSGLSSSNTHSRQGSGASTSWLNTIDESGGSVSGDSSPGWTKKKPRKQSNREIRREREKEMLKQFEDDFDSQLDAAVEAAYDDGYEVDYTYDRDDIIMMRSPRLNVERAKERVREVEREMENEIQKEKERRLARERAGFNDRRRNSDLDYFDDGDDESEEERMLEEMTRGYTLDDFEFNLESKTALPRESASTAYSDVTLPRESGSSGYSSGTWASSVSSAHLLNGTLLSTVAEAPPTPPPPTEPAASITSVSPQEPQVPPPPPPPLAPPLLVPPLLPPLAPTIQKETESGMKKAIPALPNPNTTTIPGLSIAKSSGSVRSRRLSALVEPLKVETSASNTVSATNVADVPTTVVRGPSPQVAMGSASSSEPLHQPQVSPVPPESASAVISSSLPGTASGPRDSQGSNPPVTTPGTPGRKLSSPTPPSLEPPGLGVPLTKTVSNDGTSGSPARFTPRIPGIPGSLRQIQSSASLKSRNVASPDMGSPGIPHNGLFSSSSTSNLRKAFPRSATPATPTIVPMTPMSFPSTAGLPAGGMHLFENKLNSPATPGSGEALFAAVPTPLEPCPPEPLSKPFWLMRCFYQTVAHPRGGYISARLFVPREVWFIKGVKIRAVDDKISACDLVSAALGKLATVKQNDMNALFLEMQSLEGVLDRAQAVLSKKLGSDVGAAGARSLYQTENSISENHSHDMVTKNTGISGGKSYFSLRKLRTKTSNNALANFSSNVGGNNFYGSGGLPMAGASTGTSQQPKRNLETVTFGGPHAAYISALARLFDAAQILDRLPVFDEDPAAPEKARITAKVGLELSHRHASEFFGFYICRFVLNDISLLLDKFVKRGSEWVSQ